MSVTTCDIFCKVIDNYGDIGVSWRLARQLVAEHGLVVRLWVDDLASFQRLAPALNAEAAQQDLGGVAVWRWDEAAASAAPADLVIETFACDPPYAYVEAMAARTNKPVWLNLEYLSAETWVDGYHAMPSPHPRLPLVRHFFFPGFTAKTGGLLREGPLLGDLQAYALETPAHRAFWSSMAEEAQPERFLKVSLFAYENAALPGLLDAWAAGAQPVLCVVPAGRVGPQVDAWCQTHGANHGALRIVRVPMLPHAQYDRLLAACDLNFVRGEDSFVRAQWAARPLVWHIYEQSEQTHEVKLAAFLDRYCVALPPAQAEVLRAFNLAWVRGQNAAEHWPALSAALPVLRQHAGLWQREMEEIGDLASKLLFFYKHLLECRVL